MSKKLVIDEEVLKHKLSEIFVNASVKEIMDIVSDIGSVITPRLTSDQVIEAYEEYYNSPEHEWEVCDISRRVGGRKVYGGEVNWVCKKCGKKIKTSRAGLPPKGCKEK